MKIIFFLSFCCVLFHFSYGKDNNSKLILRVWDDSEFTAVFDRKEYKTPSTKMRINKIEPGKHKLKVIKEIVGPMGYREEEVLYKGTIDIAEKTRVIAKINRFNELVIVSVRSLEKDENREIEREKRENVLSSSDFKRLLDDIEREKFESDRLNLAKNEIGEQQIKTNQVEEIIRLFGFESTKVEFTIFIYPNVVNKKNYSKINEVFIKKESITEIEDFIKQFHAEKDDGGDEE